MGLSNWPFALALLATLFASVAGVSNVVSSNKDPFPLPVFTLAALEEQELSASALASLKHAVYDVGMFAVTGFEQQEGPPAAAAPLTGHGAGSRDGGKGGRDPYGGALAAYARCAGAGHLHGHLNDVVLQDRTIRTTLATATHASVPLPLLPPDAEADCPEFAAAAGGLRASVDRTGRAYARLLDRLVHGRGGRGVQASDATVGEGGSSSSGSGDGSRGDRQPGAGGSGTFLSGASAKSAREEGAAAQEPASAGLFEAAAGSAESLEHFHLFRRPSPPPPSSGGGASPPAAPALEMHSDQGLFIVMTSAQFLSVAEAQGGGGGSGAARKLGAAAAAGGSGAAWQPPPGSGLLLELPDGRVVTPVAPDGCLLVMNGEGIERWMPRGEGPRGRSLGGTGAAAADASQPHRSHPYAPGHEVRLDGMPSDVVRAWFGRMYLPPRDAVLQPAAEVGVADGLSGPTSGGGSSSTGSALTFGEYRRQAFSAFRDGRPEEASAAGCSPTSRRRQVTDEGSCGEGELYCWMSCMSAEHVACSADHWQCRNPAGQLWPQDFIPPGSTEPQHCFDCVVACKGQSDPPRATAGLCNANLTSITMFMTGFRTTGEPNDPCVAFLFSFLPLTSWLRFVAAAAATVLMGVLSSALGHAARVRERALAMQQQAASAAAAGRLPKRPAANGCCSTSTEEPLLPAVRPPPAAPRLQTEALLAAIYATRLALAYVLMLIAMTYQVQLFLCVILGLTVGHYWFSIRVGAGDEPVDPCCV